MSTRRGLLSHSSHGLAAAALVGLSPYAMVQAQTPEGRGVIQGRVVHGVTGAALAGVAVQLRAFSTAQMQPRATLTTTADAAGQFRFGGLAAGSDDVYQPAVTYAGVDYVGPVVRPEGAPASAPQASGRADVRVFDVTHNPAAVRMARISLILAQVEQAARRITLIETIVVANNGQETYVPQPIAASAVRIAPPVGTTAVIPLVGLGPEDLATVADGGLVPAVPLVPGETALTIGYQLLYDSPRLTVSLPILAPIGQLRVLVPEGMAHLSSRQLRPLPSGMMGARRFTVMGAPDAEPGRPVTFTLSGLPVIAAPVLWGRNRPLQLGIAAAAGVTLAMLSVLTWTTSQPGRGRAASRSAASAIKRWASEVQALAGQADPDAQLRRRVLKARLLALASQVPPDSVAGDAPRPPQASAAPGQTGPTANEQRDSPPTRPGASVTRRKSQPRRRKGSGRGSDGSRTASPPPQNPS